MSKNGGVLFVLGLSVQEQEIGHYCFKQCKWIPGVGYLDDSSPPPVCKVGDCPYEEGRIELEGYECEQYSSVWARKLKAV